MQDLLNKKLKKFKKYYADNIFLSIRVRSAKASIPGPDGLYQKLDNVILTSSLRPPSPMTIPINNNNERTKSVDHLRTLVNETVPKTSTPSS
ncbi:unnamed protein product, partial [Adineta steineri]